MLLTDGCELLNAKILELQRVVPWLPMWCFVDGALMYVVKVVYRLDIYSFWLLGGEGVAHTAAGLVVSLLLFLLLLVLPLVLLLFILAVEVVPLM